MPFAGIAFATTEMDDDDLRVRRVNVTKDGEEAVDRVAQQFDTFDQMMTEAFDGTAERPASEPGARSRERRPKRKRKRRRRRSRR